MSELFVSAWLMKAIYGGCGLLATGFTLLYFFQQKLIYVPQIPGTMKEYEYSPNQARLRYRDLYVHTQDGLQLHGWIMWAHHKTMESIKSMPTILFFQANAGNLSHRLTFFAKMVYSLNCCVVSISYRGYGPNDGSPSEKGIKIDAETLWDYIQSAEEFDHSRIFLFGRSLGGAVAIDLAKKYQNQVAGLIVENTFTSISDMAPCLLPILKPFIGVNRPFNFLVRDKWENKKQITKLRKLPVLFLASGNDEMVPPHQMQELIQSCASPHTHHVFFEEARHMNAFDQYPSLYWTSLQDFMAGAQAKQS